MTDGYGLQEQLNKIADAFQKFGVELSKAIAPTVASLINLFNQYSKICIEIENAEPKLKHLALRSKKARVRKKNLNRIIKEATKG